MTIMGYKLTHDSGFAPNPFHGFLTLATCKPTIRRLRVKDDWIAGFVSEALVKRSRLKGVQVESGALIYLAQITDHPVELGVYYEKPEFRCKQPDGVNNVGRCGDNIYSGSGALLMQQSNYHHDSDDVLRDISGKNALVCRHFYYFGRNAFLPPGGWAGFLAQKPSRTFRCPDDFVDRLLHEFDLLGINPGVNGQPCSWD